MRFLGLLSLIVTLQAPSVPVLPATVQGKVVDAVTGQPLVRVTVQLRGYNAQQGGGLVLSRDTAADGTFTLQNVPPGDFMIEASRSGYIPNTSTPQQTLKSGQTANVEISLTPGAVIYGRLIDDRGDAVIGATVQALRTIFAGGRRERRVVQSVLSNDLGEYRLFMLLPGEYRVGVIEPSLSGRPAPPWFFPGTVDPSQAQAINLQVGEVLGGVSFASVPTRAQKVSGTVQGTGGNGASVILSSRGGNFQMDRVADPDTGAFEFSSVPPGAYTLVARTVELRASMPLEVRGANISNAHISLAPGFKIPVRVRIEGHGDGPDPDLESLYFIARRDPAISALEVDKYSPFQNGRFIFDLLGGSYWVEISQPHDAYVKSMKLGDVDVLNQGLQVSGSSDVPLEILVGFSTGTVTGRVSSKNSVTVVLVPDLARRNQRGLYRSARTGPSGEFAFPRVVPGDYKVFAWREENGGPWLEPDYVAMYEDRGIFIRVEGGKPTVIDSLIPVF